MAEPKRVDGADWMVGNSGAKKPARKTLMKPEGEPLAIDEAVRFLEDSGGDGKVLAAGLRLAVAEVEKLRECGLTGECLVVLVEDLCEHADNRNPIPRSTVRKVLKALFRLQEHLR